MAFVSFDTLKLADRLQAGGFSAEQAHTASAALAEVMTGAELATKSDLDLVRRDLDLVRKDLILRIQEGEMRLTLRVGAMLAATTGIVLAGMRVMTGGH